LTRARLFLLLISAALAALLVGLALAGNIPQDPAYHRFADHRAFLGAPNFGDVASNFPFLVIGVAGVWLMRPRRIPPRGARPVFTSPQERWAWLILFAGVALVGAGSAYYHWEPTTARLVWDRLPMTVVFMTFAAIQVMERIGIRAGTRFLFPLIATGIGSVAYWWITERVGHGDLRPYAVIQYFPVLAIVLMLALFPARYTRTADLAWVFAGYAAAKVFEALDAPIFHALGGAVSGHTLKHLAAAGATAALLAMVLRREPSASAATVPALPDRAPERAQSSS